MLTGDIIESTKLAAEQLNRARELITDVTVRFGLARPQTIRGAPDFFRGDAWQLLLAEPASALRLAILVRAELRARMGADTRVSVGIGPVDRIFEDNISLSSGDAFTLSGRALDKMTVFFDLSGALPDRAGPMTLWLPAVMHLCSGLMRRWTRRQAEMVAQGLILDSPTQARIANSLQRRVAPQTVQDSLASAGWRPLIDAVRVFEQTDWAALARRREDLDDREPQDTQSYKREPDSPDWLDAPAPDD